jgi:general secretion pathway protein N
MNASRTGFSWAWLSWIFSAVLAIGATVIFMLPASWVAERVASATHQRVSLDNVQGTLWSGSATVVLGSREGGTAPLALPGRATWTLDLLTLLTGRIKATVEHTSALLQPVTIRGTPASLELSAVNATLPAGVLARLGPMFATLGIDGVIRISADPMRVDHGIASGHSAITLVDARSGLSAVVPLGTYRLDLNARGDGGSFTLRTDKGPLLLSGAGQWTSASLSFRGVASAAPAFREQLADLLSILGKADGDSYVLTYGPP